MWRKRRKKLSSISRSTKISLSTSTHPHHFMEHLITPGRTALKVVSWWEFSYCSSWLKVGSLSGQIFGLTPGSGVPCGQASFCGVHILFSTSHISLHHPTLLTRSHGTSKHRIPMEIRFATPVFACEGFGIEKGSSSTLLCVTIQPWAWEPPPLHLHDSWPYGK